MAARPTRHLDRRSIERLSHLELRARKAVEGFYSGIHKSPYHGFNVEFAEYREYSPGDDPRFLDWRVLARSDKFFIKQFEAETNLNCYILLDTSGSMDFGSNGQTRLDYGASLAAAITLLMLRQGDQAGLITFDSRVRHYITPRGNAKHFAVIRDVLESVRPGEETDVSAVLHEIAERARRRSMVIVISDFFDRSEAVLNALQHFRHRRHEVIALQLLDDQELDFPFDRITMFEGLERGEQVVIDPHIMAEGYRRRMSSFLEELKHGCLEKNVDYQRMLLSEPFDRAFTAYLARRRFHAAAGGRR